MGWRWKGAEMMEAADSVCDHNKRHATSPASVPTPGSVARYSLLPFRSRHKYMFINNTSNPSTGRKHDGTRPRRRDKPFPSTNLCLEHLHHCSHLLHFIPQIQVLFPKLVVRSGQRRLLRDESRDLFSWQIP